MATEADGPVAISTSTGEGLDRTLKIEKPVDIIDKHPELHTEKQLVDDENARVEYTMEAASKNKSFEISEGERFLDPLSEISQVEESNQAGMELPKKEVQPYNGSEVEERNEEFAEDIENHDIVNGAGHVSEIMKNGDAKLDVEEVEESRIETTLDEHVQKISSQQDSIKEDKQCLKKEAEISEVDIKGAEKEEGNAESYHKEASDLLQETTFQEYEASVSTHNATDRSLKKDIELETEATPTDEVASHQPLQIYKPKEELQASPGAVREDAKTESAFENAEVTTCTEETREIQNAPEFSEKEEATPVDCPKENDTITEEVSETTSIEQETVEYATQPNIQTAENQPQESIVTKSRDFETYVEAALQDEKSSEEQAIQETSSSLVEEEKTEQIIKEEEIHETNIKEVVKCEEPIEDADATKEIGDEAIKLRTEANEDINVPLPVEEAYAAESTKECVEDNTYLSEVSEVTTKEVVQEDQSTESSYGLASEEVNEVSALEEAAAETKEHVSNTPEQEGLETTLTDEAVVETEDHGQKEESYKSETKKDIQTADDEDNGDADVTPDQPSLHIEDIELKKEENVDSIDSSEEQAPAAAYEVGKGFVESQPKHDEQVAYTDIASEETESKDIDVQEKIDLSSDEKLQEKTQVVEDKGAACLKEDEEEVEQETLPTIVTRELPSDAHADECSSTKVEELIPAAADEVDTCTKEADEEITEQVKSIDSTYGIEEQSSTAAEEGDTDLKEAGEDNKESVSVVDSSPELLEPESHIEPESCSADPQEENKDEVTYTDTTPDDESMQEQVKVVAYEAEEENKESIDNSPEIELHSEEIVSSTENLEKQIPTPGGDAEHCLTEAESEYKEQAIITDITSEVDSAPTILADQTVLESEDIALPAEENVVSTDYLEKEMPTTADEGEGEDISTKYKAESNEHVTITDIAQEEISAASESGDKCLKEDNENKEHKESDLYEGKDMSTILTEEASRDVEYTDARENFNSEEILEKQAPAVVYEAETDLKEAQVEDEKHVEAAEEKALPTILVDETPECIEVTDAQAVEINSEEVLEEQSPIALDEDVTDLKEAEADIKEQVETADVLLEQKDVDIISSDETHEITLDLEEVHVQDDENVESQISATISEDEADSKDGEVEYKEEIKCAEVAATETDVETNLGDEAVTEIQGVDVKADEKPEEAYQGEESAIVPDDHIQVYIPEDATEQTKVDDYDAVKSENEILEDSQTIVDETCETKDVEKSEVVLPMKYDEGQQEECSSPSPTEALMDEIINENTSAEVVPSNDAEDSREVSQTEAGITNLSEVKPEETTPAPLSDNVEEVICTKEETQESVNISSREVETTTEALPEIQTVEEKIIEKSDEVLPLKPDGDQQEKCGSPTPTEALNDENITEDTSAEVVPSNDAAGSLEVLQKYETEAVIKNLTDVEPEGTTPKPSSDNVEVICTKEETQESLREVETTTEEISEIQTVEEEEKAEDHAEGTDSIPEVKSETVEHETIPEENSSTFSSEKEMEKEIHEEYSDAARSFDTDAKCDALSLTESTTEDKVQAESTQIAPEVIDACDTSLQGETLVEEATPILEVQDETENSEYVTETNNKICEEVQDEPVIINRDFNDDQIIGETLTNLDTEHVEEHKIAEDYQGKEEETEQLNREGNIAETVNEGNANDTSAECVSDVTDEQIKECIEEVVESKEEITEANAETPTPELSNEDTIQNSQNREHEGIELKEENASGLSTENNEDALKPEDEILEEPETEETVTLPVVQLLLQKHEPEEQELPKSRDVLPEEMKPEPSNDNAEELTCKNEETQESLDKENDIKESDTSTEEACIVGEIEEETIYEESSSRSGEATNEESSKEEEKIKVPEDCKKVTEAKEEESTDVKNTEELIGEATVEATPQVQTHEEVAEPALTVEDETEKSYDHTEQNDKISEEVLDEPKITDRDFHEEQTVEGNVTSCVKESVEEENVQDEEVNADEFLTECVPEVTVDECTKVAVESKKEVLEESQKVQDYNGAEVLPEAETEVTSLVEEPSEVTEKTELREDEAEVSAAQTTDGVTSREVEVSNVDLEKLKSDAPEEETVERCEVVPESDTKGIDEVAEDKITVDQAFDEGVSEEPSTLISEEKELIASEHEHSKKVEVPTQEETGDILDTKSEEVICLPEEPSDLKVSELAPEKLDVAETEVEEKLEDSASVQETLDTSAPEEESAVTPEVDSESHDELVIEETNALLPEERELEASEYYHEPKSVQENIEEEKPREVEMPAHEDKQESSTAIPTETFLHTEEHCDTEPALPTPDAFETEEEVKGASKIVTDSDYQTAVVASEDEIFADQTVCEEITETPIYQERELTGSELSLEKLEAVEDTKEVPEVVPTLDSELIVLSSDETYSDGIIKEQIQSPSSTLLPEEKEHETSEPEHETTAQENSTEQECTTEVEVSANEETQALSETSQVENEEPSEQLDAGDAEDSNVTYETVSIVAEPKKEDIVDETISKEVTDLPLEVPSYASLNEEKEPETEIIADQLEVTSSALPSDEKELKSSVHEHERIIDEKSLEDENLKEVKEPADEASEYVFVARSVEETCLQKEEPSALSEANETEEVKETLEKDGVYDSQSIKEVSMDDAIAEKTVSDVITDMPLPDKIEEVKADEAELAPEKLDIEASKDVKVDSEVTSKYYLPSIVAVNDEIVTDQALPEGITKEPLQVQSSTLLPEEKEVKQTDEYENISATLDKNLDDENAKETEVVADEDTKDMIESSSEETMHSQEEQSRELKVSELSPECEEKITATPESTVVASKDDVVAEKLLPQHDEQLLVSPALVYTEGEEATLHEQELEDSKDQVETEAETKESFEPVPEVSSQSVRELPTYEIVDQVPSTTIYEEKRCDDTSTINNAGDESIKEPDSAEGTSIPNIDAVKLIAHEVEFQPSQYTERDSSNEVKNLDVATPDPRAEDSYQTPTETNLTENIEVLNKEIIDEKEVAEVSDFSSVGEENVRDSQHENESREEKYPEEKSETVTAPTEYHHEVTEVDETGNLSRDIKSSEDYIPHEKQELTCESSTTQVTYPVEKESSLEISQGILDVEEANGTTQDKRQLDEESHTAEVDSTSAQISLSEKLMEEQTNERVSHDHEDEEEEDEDEEKEDTEHKQASHSSDEPVIVEASRDSEVRVSPKKSHNILSGMGKSVKHSISKVKKAIIGKSSNSKTQPEK